jgi:hypothetical protein
LLFGKGSLGGIDQTGGGRMDTAMRNFMQKKEYQNLTKETMGDRDWRILREDNGILVVKGGRCPKPIQEWKDIVDLPK